MEIKRYDSTAWMSCQSNPSTGRVREDRRNDFKTKTELSILGALRKKHSVWLSSWEDKHLKDCTFSEDDSTHSHRLPKVQKDSTSQMRLALFIIKRKYSLTSRFYSFMGKKSYSLISTQVHVTRNKTYLLWILNGRGEADKWVLNNSQTGVRGMVTGHDDGIMYCISKGWRVWASFPQRNDKCLRR